MNPNAISANHLEALTQALRKKQMKKHLGIEDAQAPMEGEEMETESEGLDPETLAMLQQVADMGGEGGEVEIQSLKVKPEEEEV